jgi:hypothetical protein
MSTIERRMVAFPSPGVYEGMTLRDYFAAKAMQAICFALTQGIRPHDIQNLSRDAYAIADAMLKERAK